MKLGTAFVVGVVSTFVGRAAWRYYRQNRGVIIPRTQEALDRAYQVGSNAVAAQVRSLGIAGRVVVGVVAGRPSVIVQVPAGSDVKQLASQLPSAAGGLPVNIVAAS
jgi:hypothetical protein